MPNRDDVSARDGGACRYSRYLPHDRPTVRRDERPQHPIPNSPTNDGAGQNLFVEADPEYDELSSPPAASSTAIDTRSARGLRQGRGPVVPVGASSMASGAQADAARFTHGTTGFGRLRAFVDHKLRYADLAAGRVLRRLASRRYGALTAGVGIGGLLVALVWAVLAVREPSTAHVTSEQRLARAAVALRTDRARIDALATELHQAAIARGQPLTITTAPRTRGRARQGKPYPLPGSRGRH